MVKQQPEPTERPEPWIVLGSLVGFALFGLLATGVVSIPLARLAEGNVVSGEFLSDYDRMIFMLMVGVSNVLPFLLPVLLVSWFFRMPLSVFFSRSGPSPWHHILAAAGILAGIPAFSWMVIPGNLSSQYQLLLDASQTHNIGFWLLIWGIIGILPAFSEELFFRGILQNTLAEKIGRVQSVIVTALIFALIHFDLSGLLVRIVLGLLLGYVAMRTSSLWPGIVLHAVNNSSQVLVLWLAYSEILPSALSDPDYRFSLPIAAISLLLTIVFAWFWLRVTPNRSVENSAVHV